MWNPEKILNLTDLSTSVSRISYIFETQCKYATDSGCQPSETKEDSWLVATFLFFRYCYTQTDRRQTGGRTDDGVKTESSDGTRLRGAQCKDTWFLLGPPESSTNGISISLQPFLQGWLLWQADRETDRFVAIDWHHPDYQCLWFMNTICDHAIWILQRTLFYAYYFTHILKYVPLVLLLSTICGTEYMLMCR